MRTAIFHETFASEERLWDSPTSRLGAEPGVMVNLRSRRGSVQVCLRRDDGTPDGTVFMPFAYREAAANLLTNAALDPIGKIPEFKYCAVAIDIIQATTERSTP